MHCGWARYNYGQLQVWRDQFKAQPRDRHKDNCIDIRVRTQFWNKQVDQSHLANQLWTGSEYLSGPRAAEALATPCPG